MRKRQPWTEEELIVLTAIFASQKFSSGDDESQENRLIARILKKKGGSVDMQWRNIKNYLNNRSSEKVGSMVKKVADRVARNPSMMKRTAVELCQNYGWRELLPLIIVKN